MKQTQLQLLQEARDALADVSIVMHKLKVHHPDLYYALNTRIAPMTVRLFDISSWEQLSYELNRQWNAVAEENT